MDYFSKWAEAIPLKAMNQQDVIKAIRERIVHRFRIPQHLVVDRGLVFFGREVQAFYSQYNISLSHSTPYYAQGNGQAESTNKTLIEIVEKMVKENPRVWHEFLSEALWAYWTSKKEATNVTPYMLAMLMELEDLDEVRLAAFDHMVVQKQRVAKAYDKRVRRKSFLEGDLVWKTVLPLGAKTPKYGKWSPTWEGAYQICQVFRGNVYLLMDLDGEVYKHTTNGKFLKHYYPTMWEMGDFIEKQP
ncbi:uncharacterized protein LOC131317334 [Rhododendron vialii]|uniref:uncharacterized protein LOC131317334 n=1 Tax=Rhododendron vialii TaxID=182163 RepID=UPI00265F04ED|nr:uncharacterized protein LOC131317334 [Rhododendron vialii]